MKRFVGLALATALASSGCAHRQLTNQEFAVGAVFVALAAGVIVLGHREPDCSRGCPMAPERSAP
jgi:general stress protein CsbA